jgi:uncharacterized protein YndB with AHSA1/START domain
MTDVTVKHRFLPPAELVYDAWLESERARRFLFTTATGEITRCDIDARVGGAFAIVDRRNGEAVLHPRKYLELQRPKRLVFTLGVPKYSSEEDRITITIESLARGCELTLTARTADEWAEDTRLGWAMMLDVLEALLPTETTTCGMGIAQNAIVPRRVAAYLTELAVTLELHRAMLVPGDTNSKREDDVYRELAASYRDIARTMKATADRMSAQRDLPMGAHDESKSMERHLKAFGRFVHEQGALASVLRVAAERDEKILSSMQKKRRPS